MPYASRESLPAAIRQRLPAHGQDIYREAFNHAWTTYAARADREQICHRVAWAAVKRLYRRAGTMWVPRAERS